VRQKRLTVFVRGYYSSGEAKTQEGVRTLVFEVNRNRREVKIKDKNWSSINLLNRSGEYSLTEMVDPDNKNEIGSPIPGTVVTLLVKEGD